MKSGMSARGVPVARADGLGSTYTQTVPVPVTVLVWWRGALAAFVALAAILVALA